MLFGFNILFLKPVVIHADNLKPSKVNKKTYLKLQRIIQKVTNSEPDVIVPNLCPCDEVPEENRERSKEKKKNGHFSTPTQTKHKKTRLGRLIKTPTRFKK